MTVVFPLPLDLNGRIRYGTVAPDAWEGAYKAKAGVGFIS